MNTEAAPVLSPEEVERTKGGGGGATREPPAQGPEVEIDPHWPNLKLPDHPRNEGWFGPGTTP